MGKDPATRARQVTRDFYDMQLSGYRHLLPPGYLAIEFQCCGFHGLVDVFARALRSVLIIRVPSVPFRLIISRGKYERIPQVHGLLSRSYG